MANSTLYISSRIFSDFNRTAHAIAAATTRTLTLSQSDPLTVTLFPSNTIETTLSSSTLTSLPTNSGTTSYESTFCSGFGGTAICSSSTTSSTQPTPTTLQSTTSSQSEISKTSSSLLATSTSNPSPMPITSPGAHHGLTSSQTEGLVFGLVALGTILILAFWLYNKRRKRHQAALSQTEPANSNQLAPYPTIIRTPLDAGIPRAATSQDSTRPPMSYQDNDASTVFSAGQGYGRGDSMEHGAAWIRQSRETNEREGHGRHSLGDMRTYGNAADHQDKSFAAQQSGPIRGAGEVGNDRSRIRRAWERGRNWDPKSDLEMSRPMRQEEDTGDLGEAIRLSAQREKVDRADSPTLGQESGWLANPSGHDSAAMYPAPLRVGNRGSSGDLIQLELRTPDPEDEIEATCPEIPLRNPSRLSSRLGSSAGTPPPGEERGHRQGWI